MSEPQQQAQPPRGALTPEVEAAARVISREVWGQPYRLGEGPMHHAGGDYWHHALHRQADRFERLAEAARTCAEALPVVSSGGNDRREGADRG